MRTPLVPIALACLALAAPARAEDAFAEFRVPEHGGHRYEASFALNVAQDGSHSPGPYGETSFWDRSTALASGFRARWFHDSDSRQWSLGADAMSRGSWGTVRHDRDYHGYLADHLTNRSVTALESVAMFWSGRTYPWSGPFGFLADASAWLQDDQNWDRQQDHSEFAAPPPAVTERIDLTARKQYQQEVSERIGAGVGRVRDASAVAAALWLERRWLDDGAITRPLTSRARGKLAALLSIRGTYGFAHERSDKTFWRDVESLLREEGALRGETLDAYAAVHSLDPLPPAVVVSGTRLRGAWLGGSVGIRHAHGTVRTEYAMSSRARAGGVLQFEYLTRWYARQWASSTSPLVQLTGEVHRPVGAALQLDARCAATADVRGLRRWTETFTDMRAAYWLAERWQAGLEFSQFRSVRHGTASSDDQWELLGTAGVSWFVEDHWSATLRLDEWQTMRDVPSRADSRSSRLELVLGWQRGALDAPGLIEPVRPLD